MSHDPKLSGVRAAIDAVITWVDGADPLHRRKRERHMAPGGVALHANGINPHRWACADELGYCLRSIANNAPWINRIWIVTDAQQPDLAAVPAAVRAKIAIVDHRALFAGHEALLPTFNSLAIESLIWRIPGLAEQFIYFNDDVFLTAPLAPGDVFAGGKPVLRGKWVDQSRLSADTAARADPALLNAFTQINAAALAGFGSDRLFASAHVIHPLRRSVFARLFESHKPAFLANMAHRFRDVGQFLPQGLHNHACIADGACVLESADDHLHLRTGAVSDYPIAEVRAYLRRALRPEIKFLCVNDLPQVEAAIPDTRAWIEAAIGDRRIAA
ncbi:MAG: Stealth CR1 domain-containing protein [Polymorphobacter sp.]